MKELDINSWLNLEIEGNEKHYHIVLDIFEMIVNCINNTEEIEIVDIETFKFEFLNFIYLNSNKKLYKYS